MNFQWLSAAVVVCVSGAIGCGGAASGSKLPPPVKVTGVVAVDSEPVSNAMVYFLPEGGKDMGQGATGITDGSGTYELVTLVGKERKPGAIPGNYRVLISRLVRPDGTVASPKADVPPADLGAFESLPPRYSDVMMTELKANVGQDGGTFDFSVTSK